MAGVYPRVDDSLVLSLQENEIARIKKEIAQVDEDLSRAGFGLHGSTSRLSKIMFATDQLDDGDVIGGSTSTNSGNLVQFARQHWSVLADKQTVMVGNQLLDCAHQRKVMRSSLSYPLAECVHCKRSMSSASFLEHLDMCYPAGGRQIERETVTEAIPEEPSLKPEIAAPVLKQKVNGYQLGQKINSIADYPLNHMKFTFTRKLRVPCIPRPGDNILRKINRRRGFVRDLILCSRPVPSGQNMTEIYATMSRKYLGSSVPLPSQQLPSQPNSQPVQSAAHPSQARFASAQAVRRKPTSSGPSQPSTPTAGLMADSMRPTSLQKTGSNGSLPNLPQMASSVSNALKPNRGPRVSSISEGDSARAQFFHQQQQAAAQLQQQQAQHQLMQQQQMQRQQKKPTNISRAMDSYNHSMMPHSMAGMSPQQVSYAASNAGIGTSVRPAMASVSSTPGIVSKPGPPPKKRSRPSKARPTAAQASLAHGSQVQSSPMVIASHQDIRFDPLVLRSLDSTAQPQPSVLAKSAVAQASMLPEMNMSALHAYALPVRRSSEHSAGLVPMPTTGHLPSPFVHSPANGVHDSVPPSPARLMSSPIDQHRLMNLTAEQKIKMLLTTPDLAMLDLGQEPSLLPSSASSNAHKFTESRPF